MAKKYIRNTSQKDLKPFSFSLLSRSIRGKLLIWLLVISLIPMTVIGITSYIFSAGSLRDQSFSRMESTLSFQTLALENYFNEQSKNLQYIAENLDTLQQQSFERLSTIKTLRKKRIIQYFTDLFNHAQSFSQTQQIEQFVIKLKTASPNDAFTGNTVFLNDWLENTDFQAITIISPNGKILFSTEEDIADDFAIKEGTIEWQSLQKGLKETSFSDFGPSAFSEDMPVSYFSSPVGPEDTPKAAILFRVRNDGLDNLMKDGTGLGESGESYLVGPDGLFRSNSRYFEEPTVSNPAFLVETEDVTKALSGLSDNDIIINYRGEYTLSSYAPVEFYGVKWALIVGIDQTEAITSNLNDGEGDYLTGIVDNYGYPDLYLISPDGYIFATAKHKSDYLTNILTGPYSNSVFSHAVTELLATQNTIISDYSRYEPSDMRPAAFLVKPIVHENAITMIVGLQIPIDQISSIVSTKGQADIQLGDSYLVGPDKMWRTESSHTQKYNVQSTILNKNVLLDTFAVNEALSGNKGTSIIINGAGETVLSSWAPFRFNNLKWAIVSEINRDEVEKPIDVLLNIVLLIGILAIGGVIIVSLLVSRGVTSQVSEILKVMTKVEKGEYGDRVVIKSHDELGNMASSFNKMLETIELLIQAREEEHENLQESVITLLEEIANLSEGDLSIRASVREDVTGTLADSLNLMLEELSLAIAKIKHSSEQVESTANELSSTTGTLAISSDTQSNLINEAVKEINKLTSDIEQAANKSEQSAEKSKISSHAADDGAQVVQETSKAMEAIRGNVQDTARAIKRLGESSQEISDFAKTINEISDRTSILALNASIQAAAAGEEGRGFAVVAEEIQRLAERAASSTRQIETLVKNILGEITEAGTSMDASIQEVVEGTALSKNALSRLEEITRRSNEVADLINDAAAASKVQAQTTAQLAKTMNNIGDISLTTANETRDASTTMQRMASMAEEMLRSVAAFKLKSDVQFEAAEPKEPEDSNISIEIDESDDV